MLSERGFLMSGPIKSNVMESSSCHRNVVSVWKRKEFEIIGLATDYALSEDGLWRQHVGGSPREWGSRNGRGETEILRPLFQDERADFFAESNSGVDE
jgi:hypothetical protein